MADDKQRIKELLEMFSRSEDLMGHTDTHSVEAAELKKAWIQHIFASLTKLNAAVEELRTDSNESSKEVLKQTTETQLALGTIKLDFNNTLNEIKESLRVKEIKPLSDKVNNLMVRVATMGILGGLVGTGIVSVILMMFKEAIKKYINS